MVQMCWRESELPTGTYVPQMYSTEASQENKMQTSCVQVFPLTVHPPEHPTQSLPQLWIKSICAVPVNKGAENWNTNGTLCGTLKNNCTVYKTYNNVQANGYLLNSTQYRILAFMPMHLVYEMRSASSGLNAVLFISASARFMRFSTILARTSTR